MINYIYLIILAVYLIYRSLNNWANRNIARVKYHIFADALLVALFSECIRYNIYKNTWYAVFVQILVIAIPITYFFTDVKLFEDTKELENSTDDLSNNPKHQKIDIDKLIKSYLDDGKNSKESLNELLDWYNKRNYQSRYVNNINIYTDTSNYDPSGGGGGSGYSYPFYYPNLYDFYNYNSKNKKYESKIVNIKIYHDDKDLFAPGMVYELFTDDAKIITIKYCKITEKYYYMHDNKWIEFCPEFLDKYIGGE